jgi:plastocyanin
LVNADLFRHTATAKNKSFDVDLPPKARARTELKSTGAISFYCRFHPGMTGTLNVAP